MPIALLKLIVLHNRAMLRRALRGLRTARGAVFVALSAVLLVTWLTSKSLGAASPGAGDAETIRTFFPMWLWSICVLNLLTSAGERAIAFTPPEVDFLFPGPFTRRQLLGYKLLKSAAGAAVTATLFSILFLRYVQSWSAGWVGIFGSLLFLQLFSMALVLVGETLIELVHARARVVAIAAVVVVTALSILPVLRAGRGRSLGELGIAWGATSLGAAILAPFQVFGHIVGARHLAPDALPWLLAAALVLGALALVIIGLDARGLEAAARAGERLHERMERIRRGGVISRPGPRAGRLRLPLPPRLGGAGPIVWRQLTSAVRQSRAVMMLLLLLCVALGPVLYAAGATGEGDTVALMISIVFSMNTLFANALRFDFRGDLGHFEVLKGLPVRPVAIVVAQLTAPTLVLTMCQVALLIGAGVFLRIDAGMLLAAALIMAPLNALVFAIENLLFLWFPAQIWAASPGDVQGSARRMTIFLAKAMILLVACTVAATLGLAAWILAGKSAGAFVVTTASILSLETAALLPPMVVAFRRFDPSMGPSL
jgi:hypothetical protein